MSKTKYVVMMERETYTDKFYVGYDVILLFVIAVFINTQVLFQYFQSTETTQDQIFIGIFQLLMGIGGFSVGMVINRDIIDIPERARISREKSTETYLYGTFFAAVVILVDMLIGQATQSGFSLMSSLGNVNIPATAGVVEEALFSLTLAILLYKIFKEMFNKYGMMGEMYAIMLATAFTSVFFAMIHLYVYRTAMDALIMMLVNRVIYCVVFLRYRNFSMLVWMHLFHNMLVLFMGG